ncbi:hypothetical protein LCGC14_2387680, partial [marine sediment metagenome]
SRAQISILNTDGSRADKFGFPDRYTTPQEQGLYYIPLAYDNNGRIDFLDTRAYASLLNIEFPSYKFASYDLYVVNDQPQWWNGDLPINNYSPVTTAVNNGAGGYWYWDNINERGHQSPDPVVWNFPWNAINSDITDYNDDSNLYRAPRELLQEFHAERVELGTAIIQAGTGAKGMIATLPLMNFNRMRASGINSDFYGNRPEGTGLTNSLLDEFTARKMVVASFSQAAKEASLRMVSTGVVNENKEKKNHFLDTLTGKLAQGSQFTSTDDKARFIVRITQNNSASITDTRILEGLDNEVDYLNNDKTHYPLYLWGSTGENGRTFFGTEDKTDGFHTVVIWKRTYIDTAFQTQMVQLTDPLFGEEPYKRILYYPDHSFGNNFRWSTMYDDNTFLNTEQPDCNRSYYPRLDSTLEKYSSGAFCNDGSAVPSDPNDPNSPPIYHEAPGWATFDLDFLVGHFDFGSNSLVIPISELDEHNETISVSYDVNADGDTDDPEDIQNRTISNNFMEQFSNVTSTSLANNGFGASGSQKLSDTINADQY